MEVENTGRVGMLQGKWPIFLLDVVPVRTDISVEAAEPELMVILVETLMRQTLVAQTTWNYGNTFF